MYKCTKGNKLEIMKNQVGYYIGTKDEEGSKYCRYSRYYKSKETVEDLMKDSCRLYLAERECEENKWCSRKAGKHWCYEVEDF